MPHVRSLNRDPGVQDAQAGPLYCLCADPSPAWLWRHTDRHTHCIRQRDCSRSSETSRRDCVHHADNREANTHDDNAGKLVGVSRDPTADSESDVPVAIRLKRTTYEETPYGVVMPRGKTFLLLPIAERPHSDSMWRGHHYSHLARHEKRFTGRVACARTPARCAAVG
jgi:hypothetical protein